MATWRSSDPARNSRFAHRALQPHAIGTMSRTEMLDEGLARFMVEFLQAGSTDPQLGIERMSLEGLAVLLLNAKGDLSHPVYRLSPFHLGPGQRGSGAPALADHRTLCCMAPRSLVLNCSPRSGSWAMPPNRTWSRQGWPQAQLCDHCSRKWKPGGPCRGSPTLDAIIPQAEPT